VPKIFTDKATGAHVKRPELEKCLKALNAGDVLVVWKLDRLGRSLRDLIGLLDDLKTRGVVFRSLTESIDTATRVVKIFEPNSPQAARRDQLKFFALGRLIRSNWS
jgi:DNA invertase Pin-like site-specific DNA recombinase